VRVSLHVMNTWLVLVLLAGCGSKDPAPGPGSSAGSGTVAAGSGGSAQPVDAVSKSSPIEGDPAYAVIERAFKQKRPAFPLLSKDGNVAAVDLVTPIGKSGGSTYAVGFITAGADAWSGGTEPELITLVDAKLVHLLLDSMDTSAVPTIDIDTITTAATGIKQRLAEGYTRMESEVHELPVGDVIPLGPFKLKITEQATSAITLEVSDGASVQIQPVPMGRVGDVDCVAMPRVKRAWFDTPRRRLLLHVGWSTGPDQCDAPEDLYRLFRR
jgi:hypothetical protein